MLQMTGSVPNEKRVTHCNESKERLLTISDGGDGGNGGGGEADGGGGEGKGGDGGGGEGGGEGGEGGNGGGGEGEGGGGEGGGDGGEGEGGEGGGGDGGVDCEGGGGGGSFAWICGTIDKIRSASAPSLFLAIIILAKCVRTARPASRAVTLRRSLCWLSSTANRLLST